MSPAPPSNRRRKGGGQQQGGNPSTNADSSVTNDVTAAGNALDSVSSGSSSSRRCKVSTASPSSSRSHSASATPSSHSSSTITCSAAGSTISDSQTNEESNGVILSNTSTANQRKLSKESQLAGNSGVMACGNAASAVGGGSTSEESPYSSLLGTTANGAKTDGALDEQCMDNSFSQLMLEESDRFAEPYFQLPSMYDARCVVGRDFVETRRLAADLQVSTDDLELADEVAGATERNRCFYSNSDDDGANGALTKDSGNANGVEDQLRERSDIGEGDYDLLAAVGNGGDEMVEIAQRRQSSMDDELAVVAVAAANDDRLTDEDDEHVARISQAINMLDQSTDGNADIRRMLASRRSFDFDEEQDLVAINSMCLKARGQQASSSVGAGSSSQAIGGGVLVQAGNPSGAINHLAAAHPPLHNAAAVARSHAITGGNNYLHLQHQNNGLGQSPPMGWQATKHTLKERFSFMFCNEILADVHFIVGRGDQRQRVPAHKFVLSVGSAVFDAMFNGAMAEGVGGGTDGGGQYAADEGGIELPDVEPAAFLALLRFLYSDDVNIGPESVMTTLYTAKKYAVPALENACVDFLKRNLNADNAFMLLTQARLFDEPQLAALCLEMIDKHTAEALSAEGFTDIDLDTLCAVLERDTLRIREAVLYQAVARWSTEDCHRHHRPVTPENQREVLGRSLSLIRFPLMTVEEFAQSAAQSGILNDREVVNLFLYFTVNPKPPISFLDVPRCCVTGKEQTVNRFQRIEGRWGYSGTPDRIKFNVDRRIYVIGFGLYGSIHGPTEYQVTIQIIHCGTGKVLASNDTTFSCDGSATTFRVLFKEPVEISPCVTYIASACLKGQDSHYGTKGLRRIVHQSPTTGCVTFQFTYAAGNNNGTSVEDGQIPEIIFYTKLT